MTFDCSLYNRAIKNTVMHARGENAIKENQSERTRSVKVFFPSRVTCATASSDMPAGAAKPELPTDGVCDTPAPAAAEADAALSSE